jgi:PAS domain S-box-containing protein
MPGAWRLFLSTCKGVINDWNLGAEDIFGYTKQEIIGKDFDVIFTPEDRALQVPEEELRLARENRSTQDDRWHLTKDDRRIYVNGITCATYDSQGEQTGYLKLARDNTAQHEAEEALRESEWRFRKIFESAAIGIVQVDTNGRFLNANQKFVTTMGYSLEELRQKTFFEITLPEDREKNAEAFRRLLAGKSPIYESEKRCVCKTGKVIWSHVTASFLRDELGNPTTSIAIVENVTARKEAELKVRESEERLRLATEAADVGLWHWNLKTGAQEWSAIARNHLGVFDDSPASLDNFMSRLHPEDKERVEKICIDSAHGINSLEVDYRVLWPDNSTHWIWAKGRFLPDATEERNVFIGVTIDVTERKLAANRLQKAVSLFSTILESTDDGILVVDLDGRVIAHNQKFLHMWRIPPAISQSQNDEKMLQFVVEQLQEPDAFLRKVHDLKMADNEDRDEIHFKDGRIFERYSQAHRVEDRIVGRVWSFRDVTERKRTQAALLRARLQLEEHARELEQRVNERTGELQKSLKDMETFLYAIAHDLRAPLRAMSGFVGLLNAEYGPRLDEEARDYCHRIDDAAGRMNQLISDLLSYGRLSHSELPVQAVDLAAELDKVLRKNAAEFEKYHVELQVDKPFPIVTGDAPVLDQVLENLLSNALKFVSGKRPPHIHIFAEEHDQHVRLCVEDNGIGISPENSQKIFGPFQRLHTTEEYPGTGIGLAIVQRGIEKMGGHVSVESTPGQGSRFWIELPKQNGHRSLPDA